LVLYEINDLPKKKHWPEIERLMSTHPSYSASLKPCRRREESLGK
jgi:hypothetical protein